MSTIPFRRIIALLGPQGAGKTLAAQYIHDLAPRSVSLAFADPIRAMLSAYLGCSELLLETPRWKDDHIHELGVPGRTALNRFGQGMKMLFHDHIWTDHLAHRLAELPLFRTPVVITDARTEYEIGMLKRFGAEIVHVSRKGTSYSGDTYDEQPSVRLDDLYLLNYGGMVRFKDNVRKLLYPGRPIESATPGAVSGVGPQAQADLNNHGIKFAEGEGHD